MRGACTDCFVTNGEEVLSPEHRKDTFQYDPRPTRSIRNDADHSASTTARICAEIACPEVHVRS